MIRRPPRSTLFPTRRSSDLARADGHIRAGAGPAAVAPARACVSRAAEVGDQPVLDRKSTRLNSSHSQISYAVFCLKKKKKNNNKTHKSMTQKLKSLNNQIPI